MFMKVILLIVITSVYIYFPVCKILTPLWWKRHHFILHLRNYEANYQWLSNIFNTHDISYFFAKRKHKITKERHKIQTFIRLPGREAKYRCWASLNLQKKNILNNFESLNNLIDSCLELPEVNHMTFLYYYHDGN